MFNGGEEKHWKEKHGKQKVQFQKIKRDFRRRK